MRSVGRDFAQRRQWKSDHDELLRFRRSFSLSFQFNFPTLSYLEYRAHAFIGRRVLSYSHYNCRSCLSLSNIHLSGW